jgi:hypothetical protein
VEELLEFRRDYVGTPEDAIRELHYRFGHIPHCRKSKAIAVPVPVTGTLLTFISEQNIAFSKVITGIVRDSFFYF